MQEPQPRPEDARDATRCPRCGCESAAEGRAGSACPICRSPLPRTTPALVELPYSPTASETSDEEVAWQRWQHAVRVERWIWFLFVLGLLTAGAIGLVRSAN